jgi:hypothetical protein
LDGRAILVSSSKRSQTSAGSRPSRFTDEA